MNHKKKIHVDSLPNNNKVKIEHGFDLTEGNIKVHGVASDAGGKRIFIPNERLLLAVTDTHIVLKSKGNFSGFNADIAIEFAENK